MKAIRQVLFPVAAAISAALAFAVAPVTPATPAAPAKSSTPAAPAIKIIPGPKGGRILTTSAPHAEFFVEKDRKVTLTFYDAALKPVALGTQVVTAIAETKEGKVTLAFEATATGLVSKSALPAGDGYTVVVQLRERASATPVNYRVVFHAEICAECKRAEYACTCEHADTY
jgi:hypothetical protein